MTLMGRAVDWVFGYDYFIAYAWSDGRSYALSLKDALHRQGFTCFLDSIDYAKGDDWKEAGLRHLRKSGNLILVGTTGALSSEAVFREVLIFSELGRRVVPIDVDGSLATRLQSSRISTYITSDRLRISESTAAVPAAPSDRTLAELTKSFDIVKQGTKRVRALSAITCALVLLTVAAVYFGLDAKRQQTLAEENLQESRAEQLAAAADLVVVDKPFSATQGLLVSLEALKLKFRPNAYSAWQRSAQLLPPITSTLEHPAGITWAGYETKSRLLYTLTAHGELNAWNAPFAGEPTRRWTVDAAISPSVGRGCIVVADGSGGITVYTPASGAQTRRSLPAPIAQLAYDHNGIRLAAGDVRGSLYLWSEGESEATLVRLSELAIGPISFSDDGQRLVVGSGKDLFVLAVPDLGTQIRVTLPAQPTSVRFSPDAQHLAVGLSNGVAQLIDLRSGKVSAEVTGDRGRAVNHLVFLPRSNLLAISYASGRVRIADLATGLVVKELRHNGIVTTLQVDAPGDHLVVGSEDGNTYVWTLATTEVRARPDMGAAVRFAFYDAEHQLLLHAGGTRALVRNLGESEVYRQVSATVPRIVSLAQSANGAVVAAAGGIGAVRWWSEGDWSKPRFVSTGIGNAALGVAVSPDGSFVAATTRDYTGVWLASDGTLSAKFPSDGSPGLTVSIANRTVLVGRENGTAELRDLRTGELRKRVALGNRAIEASSGHPTLPYFAAPAESDLWIIDESGAVFRRWPLESRDPVTAVSFSPSSTRLALGSANGSVTIIDWQSGQVLWQHRLDDQIRGLSFSGDGQSIAVASGSLTSVMRAGRAMGYEVWDWRAKRLLATFPNVGEVNAVLMFGDGSVATEGPLGSLRIWSWRLEDLIKVSAQRADRELSEAERKRFLLKGGY